MDDTYSKMLKGINASTQSLIDSIDNSPAKLLERQLAKVESPLNMIDSIGERVKMNSFALDDLNTGVQHKIGLMRDIESLTPNIELQTAALDLTEQLHQPPPWLTDIQRSITGVMQQISPMMEAIEKAMKPLEGLKEAIAPFYRLIEEIQREEYVRRRLEDAGWLPHVTTPFEALEDIEDDSLSATLEQHYRKNWEEIKLTFLERLEAYQIDDEAKGAMQGALAVHQQGIYIATTRLLLPEIERVIRDEFYGGNPPNRSTSQIEFREVALELPVYALDKHALKLFKALDHLYDYCNTAEDELKFSAKPIPNRHAAIHGRVSYNNMCSSVNMLILADFVFQIVTALKDCQEITEELEVSA